MTAPTSVAPIVPDWVELLRQAVEKTSMAAVAERLGISRTSVSLLLACKYPAKTDLMAQRIRTLLSARFCPHLETAITGDDCQRYHRRPMPRSSARELRHWRACQDCPHKEH